MAAYTPCPVAEVDRALSNFIHSREETLKIRRTLSSYLTTSLRPVNAATKSQHVNHECPQNISATPTNPPGLKDSRLEYLQALRAYAQAQARYRELQATLEDVHQQHVNETPTQTQSDFDSGSTQSYVALLRQRRRVAELQIVQDSLEKLFIARPSHVAKDPKDLVQETVGEQPDLPAERLDQISQSSDDQTWVFKLKQEVLESRSNMDRANAARAEAQSRSPGRSSLLHQIQALERARDEIVEWVQGELAKMEEDSVFLEDASPIKRPMNNTAPVDLGSAEERIRHVYDQYTESRTSLIKEYESLQKPIMPPQDEAPRPENNSDLQQNRRAQLPITKVFPHLPHMARTANNDRSLLQQSVYLQSQILSADQDIEEALLRLAGESHLLPAGSKDVAAWGKTAGEAEAATEEFVKGHLEASHEEVGGVSRIVELCSLQSDVLASVK
jgi:hypothetical protein